jgi:hypothetical protein
VEAILKKLYSVVCAIYEIQGFTAPRETEDESINADDDEYIIKEMSKLIDQVFNNHWNILNDIDL